MKSVLTEVLYYTTAGTRYSTAGTTGTFLPVTSISICNHTGYSPAGSRYSPAGTRYFPARPVVERNSNHWWTRNSKQSYCILKLVIMEVLFYTTAGTRYFIFSLASTGYFILKCLVLGTFLWRQNDVTQRLSLWWRSCPAWWWSAGMHPGHLAPT